MPQSLNLGVSYRKYGGPQSAAQTSDLFYIVSNFQLLSLGIGSGRAGTAPEWVYNWLREWVSLNVM
jgi:hypothetical protein